MPIEVDDILRTYDDGDWSVRLLKGVCAVVPFGPQVDSWYNLVDGLKAMDPAAKKQVLDRALELTRTPEAQRALWMVKSLDTADLGISAFSGVRTAYKLYQAKTGAERLDALETDQQQAVDAVLKGLCMAFVVYYLFPGGPTEKVAAFRNTQAGQAWIYYYAAIEVGLPFSDNALLGGGQLVASLWDKYGPAQQQQLAAVAGEGEAKEAAGMLQTLIGPLETMAKMASGHLSTIAGAVAGAMPGALNVADKAAGVAATGADALSVYRYLGARLVGEACLRRALEESKHQSTAVAAQNPAAVEVKYTRSANDLPESPPKRGGCFLLSMFGIFLLAAGLSASSAAAWWVLA